MGTMKKFQTSNAGAAKSAWLQGRWVDTFTGDVVRLADGRRGRVAKARRAGDVTPVIIRLDNGSRVRRRPWTGYTNLSASWAGILVGHQRRMAENVASAVSR